MLNFCFFNRPGPKGRGTCIIHPSPRLITAYVLPLRDIFAKRVCVCLCVVSALLKSCELLLLLSFVFGDLERGFYLYFIITLISLL